MKHVRISLAALSISLFISGCYKAGCTNPEATNYNPEVKTEDQSCTYTGNLVFWCSPTVSDSLLNIEGHDMLRFELEGVLVDSIATANLKSATGDCNGAGTKTIVRNFADNTERYYKYRVKGYGLVTIYEGFVQVEANDCVAIKLL
jgi:hypothetical protein